MALASQMNGGCGRIKACAWCVLLCGWLALPAFARNDAPPRTRQGLGKPLNLVAQQTLPGIDAKVALKEDQARPSNPLRFAIAQAVQITPQTHGTWEEVPGGRLWRMRFHSRGATDLNFAFTTFWLPEGATLHISSLEEDYFQGPYTAKDNKPHQQLWTPVIPGGSGYVELFVPTTATAQPRLALSQVNTGYRDMFKRRKNVLQPAEAGLCENDVACAAAAPWTNEIRSVARYSINGTHLCSGTLVSDVAGSFRNFFLSANHCGVTPDNAAGIVVYWNFQSPTCGQHGGGSLAQNQIGATFRAAKADVDVVLLELEETPDAAFRVFYSGWDRTGVAPTGAVGIHHPNGDEKSISFSSNLLTSVSSCIAAGNPNTHWQVVWRSGVTEVGSSGSGIWHPVSRRLIGTLSGGDSSCSNPFGPDCYGKFSVAWASGASASSRLQNWLDPFNTGTTSVAGRDPNQRPLVVASGYTLSSESCPNNAVDPGEVVTVQFALKNIGMLPASNVIATLQATGGVTSVSGSQNFGALLANGTIVSRPFTFTATGNCGGNITATLVLQTNSGTLGSVSFQLPVGQANVVLAQNFDGVSAPLLPEGWTTASDLTPWATSTGQWDTSPNAVFAPNEGEIADNSLFSPAFTASSANSVLNFRHSYNLEDGFDGGVLEISLNGGSYTDIEAAGGSFLANGYNGRLTTLFDNPLGERDAWTGNSGGFVTTTVQLPAGAVGVPARLRWRLGSDDSNSEAGWYLDTVNVVSGYQCCRTLVAPTIVNPRLVGSQMAFSFNTVTGQAYVVESSPVLGGGQIWTAIRTNAGNGLLQSYTNGVSGAQRFFRLRSQ